MIGLIVGVAIGGIAALLLLGVVLTVNIDREESLDEMSLETTNGVIYRTFTIDGDEGVMVGKDNIQFLTREDLKEMLEVLDGPKVKEVKKED